MTNQIAQNNVNIPGYSSISGLSQLRPEFHDLGSLLSQFLDLAFIIAVFLSFFWLIWGAFQYLFAGGDKQALSSARKRLTWAIVGLLILSITFALAQWAESILRPGRTPFLGLDLVTPVYAQSVTPRPSVPIENVYEFGWIKSLGQGVDLLVDPTFAIATTAVTIYLVIGGFKFLLSAGNKDAVSGARAMITHAIIGFMILIFIFLILQFIPEFFGINFKIIGP